VSVIYFLIQDQTPVALKQAIIEKYNLKRYALTLKILLGFFAFLAVAVVILGWRLSNGPIALDWAGDYLKKALMTNQSDVRVDFRDAVLMWQTAGRKKYAETSGLQIIFYEFEISRPESDFSLKLPEAGVRFSGLAMMRGLLAPTDVEFSNLSLDYTLDENVWQSTDSRPFLEKLESFLENFRSSTGVLEEIVRELLSPPKSSDIAGYLRQITFKNTEITVTDQLSGQKWRMPEAQLNLRRTDLGLMINLAGDIDVAATKLMPLDLSVIYDNAKQEALTILQFTDLRASALAGRVKALAGLAAIDIPAKGNIEFTVDRNFDIPAVAFSLALGAGQINAANIYPKPLNVTSAALNGHIQKNENVVVLEEISLQLGETALNGSGLLSGTRDRPGISLRADIVNLPFSDVKSYWPGQFGKGAYDWINENIDAGIVPSGELNVHITPEMWPAEDNQADLPAEALTFRFDVENIKAHYLRPMPVLNKISGHALLNLHSFHLATTGGKIETLDIRKADLLFSDIHVKGGGAATITLELEGAVEEVLRVIDHEPLGYPSQYGIKQDSITGHTDAVVSLKFPLLKKVSLKDVVFDVKADIARLSIPALTESLAIDDGRMKLHVDDNGIEAAGNITLNGVDFTATWHEDFKDNAEFPTKYAINGPVEGAAWERLNLPFDPYIEGPVEIDLALYGAGGTLKQGAGRFNLLDSRSSFAPLGWDKKKGKVGQVTFDMLFDGPENILLKNVTLRSDALQADLELDLTGDRVTRFDVPRLTMNHTDMAMFMEWNNEKKRYEASLTGKAFQGSPLIDILTASTDNGENIALPDFDLEATIDTLMTKNNVRISAAKVQAVYRQSDFTHVDFSGKMAEDKTLEIKVYPHEENRKLAFDSNNAGEALRGLGLFNLGVGGDMALTADMVKHEEGISLGGHAEISDFKVIKSPGFSKLLEEKKFAKAQAELDKGGLSFNDFEMEFRQYNGVLEISKARARGPMLGMTIEGFVDQSYDEMGISGTLIPAYGLNSLISNIPLIGTILTGGKGQGIFAATYSISGPLDNPDVKINPLAALAPGILRSIFSAIGGGKKKTLREQAEELQKVMPNSIPDTEHKPPPD